MTGDITDLYRRAVLSKLHYEKVRDRIMTISKIINRTPKPARWRDAAHRSLLVGQKRRRLMHQARRDAREQLFYDPQMEAALRAEAQQAEELVRTYEELRRRGLS